MPSLWNFSVANVVIRLSNLQESIN
jgi:hypothetical protein